MTREAFGWLFVASFFFTLGWSTRSLLTRAFALMDAEADADAVEREHARLDALAPRAVP